MTNAPTTVPSETEKERATAWFNALRDQLCATFEGLEDAVAGSKETSAQAPGRFERSAWQRNSGDDDGGGVMSVMRGRVLEKVGVNVSTVWGEFSEKFRGEIPGAAEDPRFWASGISVVAHPCSPLVPAAHMNTRLVVTTTGWFGGGCDLTPVIPDAADTEAFHGTLKRACDTYDADCHERFKAWCDEYFHLPHRDEPRGIGGIFFDRLDSGDRERDFAFVQEVGRAFLDVYPAIVGRRMNAAWSADQRRQQLVKRGRYVEFNLLHDRGTRFGLMTGGNTEAILMSLPPLVMWP